MSISRWMDKKDACTYTMEYYSAIKKNAFESVLMRWIKLEPIIQSEVSQKEKPILYINVYIWNLERWWLWPYMRDSKRDTEIKNNCWTLWERVRMGWFGRIALKHVYYHMWTRSPVQVQCMRQGAQGLCTGMTLRNEMRREVGGRFRLGNTCTPMADLCQCMAKTATIL